MNKKTITIMIAIAAVCGDASAQPKEGGRCPAPIYARDFSKMEVVDTTRLRVRYAFCAEKINDHLTYIDLQRLDVGKRVTKYYSQFVYQSDSLRSKYAKKHPNAQAAPNWMGVQCRMHDQWSEYEWSDYFIENGQLTEYCQMPQWLHRYNSKYREAVPKQEWKLSLSTDPSLVREGSLAADSSNFSPLPNRGGVGGEAVILGYRCQKATCHFRGRDFIAWFAPAIPVKRGPWKFGGLPGLILKVQDKDGLYTFEAIGIETRPHPITRFKQYKEYTSYSREKVWKMQRSYHENWFKATDFHKATINPDGTTTIGEAMSIYTPYNPLELE